jgi:non-heme Fe2+,alpha-ketoglutarate-dependent halogenase
MPKVLSNEQIDQYRRDGYVYPVRAFSHEAAVAYRARLEASERQFGPLAVGKSGSKTHLLFTWADEIIRTPALLDAVEDLIGPDILVYQLTMWIKPARDDAIVDWHQDASYFGLEPYEHVTAWVALSDATSAAGCVKVVPGSHLKGQLHHAVRQGRARNMLPRGQSVSSDYDANTAVEMPLKPGEFSLHHTLTVHGSEPNRANDRRIGLGISYIPARVRFTGRTRLSAAVVRGVNRYDHFDPEPRPQADFDAEARAAHERITRAYFASKQELADRFAAMPAAG